MQLVRHGCEKVPNMGSSEHRSGTLEEGEVGCARLRAEKAPVGYVYV
jgi:hypothetical protein